MMAQQSLLAQHMQQQQQRGGTPGTPGTPVMPNVLGAEVPCWKLPFESSSEVKLQIRGLLGEEGFSKGHVRLVTLPLVHNVLSERPEFRDTFLYRAIHHVLQHSTYEPLLKRKKWGGGGGSQGAAGTEVGRCRCRLTHC